MVDPNATYQYPMTKYSCYHATTTIPTRKKKIVPVLQSWYFLRNASFLALPANATIQMLAPWYLHPNIASSYHHTTTIPMLLTQCYHLDDIFLTIPSQCSHLNATIKALPSRWYQPDAILLHHKKWVIKAYCMHLLFFR